MQVWNVLHAAGCKCRTQKVVKNLPSGHHHTTLSGYIFATKAHVDNWKNLLSSNISSTCPHNIANFGPLAAEIGLPVWDTPAIFNGFRVLAALLHGSQVVSVGQTLRRWTEGATYVRQGDHHMGIGPHSSFILTWNHGFNQPSWWPGHSERLVHCKSLFTMVEIIQVPENN